MEEAKKLHKKMRSQIVDLINTNIELLILVDEKPTLVQILGSLTSEIHDILIEKREKDL